MQAGGAPLSLRAARRHRQQQVAELVAKRVVGFGEMVRVDQPARPKQGDVKDFSKVTSRISMSRVRLGSFESWS